jgi:hypothetical protein
MADAPLMVNPGERTELVACEAPAGPDQGREIDSS